MIINEMKKEILKDVKANNIKPVRKHPGLTFDEFNYFDGDRTLDYQQVLRSMMHKGDTIDDFKLNEIPLGNTIVKQSTYDDNIKGFKKLLSIEFIPIKCGGRGYQLYYIKTNDYINETTSKYYTYCSFNHLVLFKTLNMMQCFRDYFNDYVNYPKDIYQANCLYCIYSLKYKWLDMDINHLWGTHIMNTCNYKGLNKLFKKLKLKPLVIWDRKNSYYKLMLYQVDKI